MNKEKEFGRDKEGQKQKTRDIENERKSKRDGE